MIKAMFQNKCLKFYKTVHNDYLTSCSRKQSSLIYLQKRHFFSWINWLVNIFNSVDKERIELVGHECACAEWLLRNGASVRFKGHDDLLSDYNELINLEEIDPKILKIEEVYAKEAYLTSNGFDHLSGCNHIKKMTFIFCSYLTNSTLVKLKYVKNTLEYLEIISCFNIKDEGLISLGNLSNLKTLVLADLVSVKNKEKCEDDLRKALPQCKIDFQK